MKSFDIGPGGADCAILRRGSLLMQRVNEYRFYELGQRLHMLKDIKADSKLNDCMLDLWFARELLERLLQDPVKLTICGPVAQRIVDHITNLVPADWKDAVVVMSSDAQAGSIAYHIRTGLEQFEAVLAAELAAMDTYVVSQKGGYSTRHLVDQADVMLTEEIRGFLGQAVIDDIRAAGRCLAFDTPTAAGFHVLRAVEAVMTDYQQFRTGSSLSIAQRNWGAALKGLKDAGASEMVLGALTHIKDNYRNPISHPEDTLSDKEATMLFALSTSVIDIMAGEMMTTTATLPGLLNAPPMTHTLADPAQPIGAAIDTP